ncbi:hypothetical protein ACSBM8_04125 [Sphingomonas sp. ASY06-1R]|jgi:hypothetical protein|uniref:hypothetical protein n=1 Tax=Sphingomonas sp. ASY06-1R TaxID=3445771 RepID=UPI003FA2EAFA
MWWEAHCPGGPISYLASMDLTLVSGGILRDGGSIFADFRREDGSLLSLLLEVNETPEPGEERHFRHLHVGSTIQDACDHSTIISKGSEQEAKLLVELHRWAKSGKVAADEEAVASLKELLAHLTTRNG